jgi:methyltransferase
VTSLTVFVVVVALVTLQRLLELVVSRRNAAWSLARGGVETGRGHYPVMVALHSAFLVGMVVEAFVRRPVVPAALAWSMLVLLLAAQAVRWWCVVALGHRWTTQVVVVPGLPRVRTGPYRWLRHPNYLAVVVEGVALPLLHACWITALAFTVLNAALLRVRIRTENAALESLPDPASATERYAPGGERGRPPSGEGLADA